MCAKAPRIVERDPEADAAKAAAEAAAKANTESALARARRRRSALDTGAGQAASALGMYGQQRRLGGD